MTSHYPLKPECVEYCGTRFKIMFESHDSAGLPLYDSLLIQLLLISLMDKDGCHLIDEDGYCHIGVDIGSHVVSSDSDGTKGRDITCSGLEMVTVWALLS